MERLRQIKGSIFDLDGTLLDSMGIWEQIDAQFLERRGIPLPPDYAEAVKAMEFSQVAEYTIRRFGLQETPQALMEEWTALSQQAYARQIELKPGAKEYLAQLAEQGVLLGIATSATEELFIPALRHNGVWDLFAAHTTTGQVARGKGFPDIYWATAEKLGLRPEECAVFEDILPGVQGARQGGFLTVGVYDPYSEAQWEQMQKEASLCIRSFEELLGQPV